MNMRITWS